MPAQFRIVAVQGREVGLAEYGDPAGRPVLALHGAPAARLLFEIADAAARARGFRLLCPDRPGYGRSAPDHEPVLGQRAANLEAVADALGLGRFAFLGVSGGAPYAVALASRLGPRCTALALVSPIGPLAEILAAGDAPAVGIAPGLRRVFIDLQRGPRTLSVGSRLAALAFRVAPHLCVATAARHLAPADHAVLSRSDTRSFIVALTREALRQGVGGGLADLTIYSRPWNVDYARITAPTIVWQGAADHIVPPVAA